MISNEEVSYKASAQADGTAHDLLDELVSNSFKPVEEIEDDDSDCCTEISEKLVIISTKNSEDSDSIDVTYSVGEFPNAKQYTEDIDDMMDYINKHPERFQKGNYETFKTAKELHEKRENYNPHFPFGNDIDDDTFTLQSALANGCVVQTPIPNSILVKTTVDTERCATYILEHIHLIFTENTREVMVYKNGRYVNADKMDEVNLAVEEMLGAFNTIKITAEITAHIKNKLLKDKVMKDDGGDIICLENGNYNRVTKEWSFHAPDLYLFHQHPFPYDPSENKPLMNKYLWDACRMIDTPGVSEEQVKEDQQKKFDCVYEWFGYHLLPGQPRKKFAWIFGDTNTFKTVTGNGLRAFLGEEYVSSVSLAELTSETEKFATSDLYGKYGNISTEPNNQTRAESLDKVKTITGREKIRVQRKNQNAFDFYPRTKLTVLSNDFPALPETHLKSFFTRVILIPFQQVCPDDKIDENLESKLYTKKGLSGIFNEALMGLERLEVNNGFSYDKPWEEKMQIYMMSHNVAKEFLENYCVILDDGEKESYKREHGYEASIICAELFKKLDGILKQKQITSINDENYVKAILDNCNRLVTRKRDKNKGNKWCFKGLIWKDEVEESDESTKVTTNIDEMYDIIAQKMEKGPVTLGNLRTFDEVAFNYALTLIDEGILKVAAKGVLQWSQ